MRKIVFEDGTTFVGEGFGASGTYVGTVAIDKNCFNYEKALESDDDIVLFTYPLIGNYGVTQFVPKAKAMIVQELCKKPNHYEQVKTLEQACQEHGIIGIEAVDTRAIAQKLYNASQKLVICDANVSFETIAPLFGGN